MAVLILDSEYHSQWDSDANAFNSDCGPAAVKNVMSIVDREKWKDITIDRLSWESGMSHHRTYTMPFELIMTASIHGLSLARMVGMTMDDLRAEILAGRPVIALVHYGDFGALRMDTYSGGHWLVVTGWNDDAKCLYVNDPDWKEPRRNMGHNLPIPLVVFEDAWGSCSDDNNTNYQALVVRQQE